jgi:hypothetical protein
MQVFRFMSKIEFEKYKSGQELINDTVHQGKTNSIGFCFFNIDDYKPEQAMHFLSGIATLEICVVFEVHQKLNKSWGGYAKLPPATGNLFFDLYNILNNKESFQATEYCTNHYNNKTMQFVKFSDNLWQQYEKKENQPELKWRKI